jgi:uncharacterized protein with NAD-binding domain and iron-sulfur cluster
VAAVAKTRVAIVGGGPAALSAAFELTATPELQNRYDITIYQPGWRLGGKCASGRNMDQGYRIEEHGLHVWFGCYDNAFWTIRRAYAELDRDPVRQAMASWRDAFVECRDVVVWDKDPVETWDARCLWFPPNMSQPGVEREREFPEIVRETMAWIDRRLRALKAEDDAVARAVVRHPLPAPGLRAEVEQAGVEVERAEHLGIHLLGEAAARRAERHLVSGAEDELTGFTSLLGHLRTWALGDLRKELPNTPETRFVLGTIDIAVAGLTGILKDGLLFRGFDEINHLDLSEWLARHGAEIDTEDPELNNPFLRGVYDGSFAFVDGDPRKPDMAAGRSVQGAIRCLFHYNGSVLWRMQAGMGDAVIAPLYEVLEKRDVKFEFFHAVEKLVPSADGRQVEKIVVVPQVKMKAGPYEPLVEIPYKGKPLDCWPDRPLFDQLARGTTKKVQQADFEHAVNPLGVEERTTLEAGKHFDVAILAVPPPVQEEICKPLIGLSGRYAAMLGKTKTVITQAAQLWLDRTPEQLGWKWTSNSLMSMYVEPIDTYCDMSHLLPCEHWPGDDVRHIAYFCGVIRTAEVSTPAKAAAAVRRYTQEFLEQDAGRMWPNVATNPDGTGFNWNRLVAPDDQIGPARLGSQYLRVNHQASEQYVLTLKGTVASRLWPKERCFENLVFAGDWTRNGFDAGCVEGAITSGMLAAQAICGLPADKDIAGLHGPTGFPNGPLAPRGCETRVTEAVNSGVALVGGVLGWAKRQVERSLDSR